MKRSSLTLLCVLLLSAGPGYAQEARNPDVRALESTLLRARPLPLKNVRLGGGPLKNAQDLDARTLLGLQPDHMLAYYRKEAGLEPRAEGHRGWDGGGRNLTGHIAGHYLSAVSLMYATTGDVRFKERADYLVKELKEVQDAHGDGYLSALAGGRACWQDVSDGEIRSGGFDLNGLWAPWYTLHKTYCSVERRRGNAVFDIQIDGEAIARQTVERSEPLRFYDVEYAIAAARVVGKEKVTVRFQSQEDSAVAGVYGLRMIRADAER